MTDCATVVRSLERHGLLLQQDKTLPSVVGTITGASLASSWWSHPRAQDIFDCLGALIDRDDVLMTRLVAKKLTYVHARLWPAFLAVATAAEEWQTRGLSPEARTLLRTIESAGEARATGAAARELQDRLLVDAVEVHTEEGKHAMALRAWSHRAAGMRLLPLADAKRTLEEAVIALGGKTKMLAWNGAAKK